MQNKNKLKLPKIKLAKDFWVVFWGVILLFPAVVFWTSVTFESLLGADYVFDVILANLSSTWLGNMLITVLVIGGPALVVAISGMNFMKTKNKKMMWELGVGGAFLILGLFTLVKRG
jgi:hypothetical protein